jgi:alkaline phosphatase D
MGGEASLNLGLRAARFACEHPRMKRRDFLRTSGWFVVGAALAGVPGCDFELPPNEDPIGTYAFPQGLASGDPRPASVVLWTRVERTDDTGPIDLVVQVATDDGFSQIVVDKTSPPTSTAITRCACW